jgi:hypothetical protein
MIEQKSARALSAAAFHLESRFPASPADLRAPSVADESSMNIQKAN